MIVLLLALSFIMWYLINRAKNALWEPYSWGKWLTIGSAAILGFVLAFGFKLDIIYACDLVEEITPIGQVLTALTLMSGSSAVSEVISYFRGE